MPGRALWHSSRIRATQNERVLSTYRYIALFYHPILLYGVPLHLDCPPTPFKMVLVLCPEDEGLLGLRSQVLHNPQTARP